MSNENTNKRLQELSKSNFEIAEGEPDIRGWDVKDASDKKIGEVDELIFDEESRKVRYIVIDLEGNVLDLDSRDVLVPIGIAQLHDKNDDVILPGVTAEQLRSLPDYEKGSITDDLESKIRTVFAGVGGAALASVTGEGDFYNHGHFNDENLYSRRGSDNSESQTIPVIKEELQVGKREVEKGGVRLKTRIVEHEVEKNVNLREEKVHIERTAVNRPASSADLKEEQIEVTERAEVPVVAKEARVVEEILLNKEVNEKEELVKGTVRHTEVDVDGLKADSDDLTGYTNKI